jgi:hypothetical protein
MAILSDVFLKFNPSDSPDVKSYRLYVVEAPADVKEIDGATGKYKAPFFNIGLNTNVDLNGIAGFPTKDAVYNLGVTALDDVGNESEMMAVNDVPLDFAAPNPVSGLTVIRL